MQIKVHTHLSPRIIEILSPTTDISVQEIVDTLRDWEDDNLSYERLISAAGKENLGGGVTVGITATLQNARLMFSGRTVPIGDVGLCTADNVKGDTLVASAGSFLTDEIYRGCTVFNLDSVSMAGVSEVVSETELRMFPLSGGTRDDWVDGDRYMTYPNVQCNILGGNLVAVDDTGSELSPVMQSPNVQVVKSSSSSATISDVSSILWDVIFVNDHTGVAGTDYPIGTAGTPSNNLPDALAIARREGITKFNGRGTFIVEESFSEGTAVSDNILLLTLDLNGQHVVNSDFSNMILIGDCAEPIRADRCIIDGMENLAGVFSECGLQGNISFSQTEWARFFACYGLTSDNVVFDMQGSAKAGMADSNLSVEVMNMTSADAIFIKHGAGNVTVGPSNTAGTVHLGGEAKLVGDIPSGVTLINDTTAHLVWEESSECCATEGTMGYALNFIKNIEGGRWARDGTEMIFYREDNTTEIARFNLYDASGNIAGEEVEVFERRRV